MRRNSFGILLGSLIKFYATIENSRPDNIHKVVCQRQKCPNTSHAVDPSGRLHNKAFTVAIVSASRVSRSIQVAQRLGSDAECLC